MFVYNIPPAIIFTQRTPATYNTDNEKIRHIFWVIDKFVEDSKIKQELLRKLNALVIRENDKYRLRDTTTFNIEAFEQNDLCKALNNNYFPQYTSRLGNGQCIP